MELSPSFSLCLSVQDCKSVNSTDIGAFDCFSFRIPIIRKLIMPSNIAKNLNLCFKCPSTNSSSLLTPDDDSRCPLFTSAAATATAAFKNYNSLYDNTFDEYYSTSKPLLLTHSSSSISSSESDSEPDFASVFASQRFFFTSPGSSNSIIESIPPSSTTTSTPESSDTLIVATSSSPTANQPSSNDVDQQQQQYSYSHATTSFSSSVKDSVAVSTLSPNPFMDFRRSMQEMVEARGIVDDVKANWDYLHELLLCYLAINPKTTHKFIIAAFADLLVSLMAAGSGGGMSTETSQRLPAVRFLQGSVCKLN